MKRERVWNVLLALGLVGSATAVRAQPKQDGKAAAAMQQQMQQQKPVENKAADVKGDGKGVERAQQEAMKKPANPGLATKEEAGGKRTGEMGNKEEARKEKGPVEARGSKEEEQTKVDRMKEQLRQKEDDLRRAKGDKVGAEQKPKEPTKGEKVGNEQKLPREKEEERKGVAEAKGPKEEPKPKAEKIGEAVAPRK